MVLRPEIRSSFVVEALQTILRSRKDVNTGFVPYLFRNRYPKVL